MNELLTALTTYLGDNQFMSAGFVLGALAALGVFLRRVPRDIYNFIKRRCTTEIQITSQDPAFDWLRTWLAQQPYTQRARRWLLFTTKEQGDGRRTAEAEAGPDVAAARNDDYSSQRPPQTLLTPAPGHHLFRYQGRLVWLTYEREKMQHQGLVFGFYESMFLYAIGRDATFLEALIQDAYELSLPKDTEAISINISLWGNWRHIQWIHPRTVESLVFDNDLTDNILDDIGTFFDQKDWYQKMGIPWRRGYLLHGEPGNGKTSLVTALAGRLRRDLYVLPLSEGISDSALRDLMLDVPVGSVVLIEDIDTAFLDERDEEKDQISRSGLLNAIDGVGSKEGRLLFMTTNKLPTDLDVALVRPGRADLVLHLGNATKTQAEALFERFHPGDTNGLAGQFGRALVEDHFSMADLQSQLIKYSDRPEMAVAALRELSTGTVNDAESSV